ncbi:hypothetical protein EPO34_03610 [Patescibacteria group bacterium]|nr:MAG: hypothetical protein EPO34_03610 [Patescibacteria group bacterium]
MATEKNYTLEKIDEQTARKTDTRQSVTIVNVEDLRRQKAELEKEIADRQKMLAEIEEIITEFDKLK